MWCVLVKDRSTRIIHTNQKATVSSEFNTIIMLLLKNLMPSSSVLLDIIMDCQYIIHSWGS